MNVGHGADYTVLPEIINAVLSGWKMNATDDKDERDIGTKHCTRHIDAVQIDYSVGSHAMHALCQYDLSGAAEA